MEEKEAALEEKESALAELEEAAAEREKQLLDDVAATKAANNDLQQRLKSLEAELDARKDQDEKSSQAMTAKSDRVERELNDEIEALKAAKKKLKAVADASGKEVEAKDKEIARMEGEVKSLLQAEKQQQQTVDEARSETSMLRKQVKELNAKVADAKASNELEAILKEKNGEIENLRIQVNSLRKEDQAFEVIKGELDAKSKEKDELASKMEKLRSEVEAKEYDLQKMKDERDVMMKEYDQRLRKKTEDLNIERREMKKMREVMAKSTPGHPSSASSKLTEEINMLREELTKKTEIIKKLEPMISAKKELTYPSSEEDEDEGEKAERETLRGKVTRLLIENEKMKVEHAREIEKVKKANDLLINEYKDTNKELQRQVSDSQAADADDESGSHDVSLISATPSTSSKQLSAHGRGKKRRRKGEGEASGNNSSNRASGAPRGRARRTTNNAADSVRAKVESASQVSFEDSNAENDEPASTADEMTGGGKQPVRKSTRLKRSRPVRKTRSASVDESQYSAAAAPLRETNLDSIDESSPAKLEALLTQTTPAPSSRKRHGLFNPSAAAEQFTPPDPFSKVVVTPRTAVKRQLRPRTGKRH